MPIDSLEVVIDTIASIPVVESATDSMNVTVRRIISYVIDAFIFGILVFGAGRLAWLISKKGSGSISDVLTKNPRVFLEQLLTMTTIMEVLSLAVIALNRGMSLTAAFTRYPILGLLELMTAFLFSAAVAKAISGETEKEREIDTLEWASIVLFFGVSFSFTWLIAMCYYEAEGVIATFTGYAYILLELEASGRGIELSAMIMIWCTPVLNIILIKFMYDHSKKAVQELEDKEDDEYNEQMKEKDKNKDAKADDKTDADKEESAVGKSDRPKAEMLSKVKMDSLKEEINQLLAVVGLPDTNFNDIPQETRRMLMAISVDAKLSQEEKFNEYLEILSDEFNVDTSVYMITLFKDKLKRFLADHGGKNFEWDKFTLEEKEFLEVKLQDDALFKKAIAGKKLVDRKDALGMVEHQLLTHRKAVKMDVFMDKLSNHINYTDGWLALPNDKQRAIDSVYQSGSRSDVAKAQEIGNIIHDNVKKDDEGNPRDKDVALKIYLEKHHEVDIKSISVADKNKIKSAFCNSEQMPKSLRTDKTGKASYTTSELFTQVKSILDGTYKSRNGNKRANKSARRNGGRGNMQD
jgi:hypothetical protein